MPRRFFPSEAPERNAGGGHLPSDVQYPPAGRGTKVLILAHARGEDPFTLIETSIPALAEIFLAAACRQLPSFRFEARTVPRDAGGIHTPAVDRYHEAD